MYPYPNIVMFFAILPATKENDMPIKGVIIKKIKKIKKIKLFFKNPLTNEKKCDIISYVESESLKNKCCYSSVGRAHPW